MKAKELANQLMTNPDGEILIIDGTMGKQYVPMWADKDISDDDEAGENTTLISILPKP